MASGVGLQATVGDQIGQPLAQGVGHLLTRDHRDVGELVGVLLKHIVMRESQDVVAVGQFGRRADAVNEDDFFVLLPGMRVRQNREKRRKSGPGGKQPEVSPPLKTRERQKSVILFFNQQGVSDGKPRELGGELAIGHNNGVELQGLVVGSRHHGVRAPCYGPIGFFHAQAGKLSCREAEATRPRDPK